MNAPTPAAALTDPTLELLELTAIVPSTTHIQELRRARFDKKALQDLADSIKQVGVLQAVVVRPRGPAEKFELVAGERRWLAAKLAGLQKISASVRTLTPEQVLEVQLIENLQREGLHELEEAEGYEELMKLKRITVDTVATMVGKSRSYVYARTKLLALCPEARKAFYAGEIDASRALLVARIGHHDTQRQALADVTQGPANHWNGRREGGAMSYRDAHKHILANFMLKLKEAPFDPKDAQLLPKAGACPVCPKRTGNQQDLFGDVKDADVCTDPKCFDDKRQAHQAVARKELEAKGRKVIHGPEARKILPHWESPNAHSRDHLQGGYVPLDHTTWASGQSRKVSELLGPDFDPVLIQHPGTGKIIRAATELAVNAAVNAKRAKSSGKAKRPAAGKPAGPNIDDLVFTRTIAAAHKKLTGALGKPELALIAGQLLDDVREVCPKLAAEAISTAWGFKSIDVASSDRLALPVHVAKLDARKLGAIAMEAILAIDLLEGRGRFAAAALKRLKIDQAKIRKDITAELKAKAAATKAATTKAAPAIAKRRAAFSSFMRPLTPSPALAAIVGAAPLAKIEVTKKIWGYIKRNGLQDKKNRRMINADEKLQLVFKGKKQVSMFGMTKLVAGHLSEQTKAAKAKTKSSAK